MNFIYYNPIIIKQYYNPLFKGSRSNSVAGTVFTTVNLIGDVRKCETGSWFQSAEVKCLTVSMLLIAFAYLDNKHTYTLSYFVSCFSADC